MHKIKAILNDPIYKTLDPEQQQIFMYIKLCPFPEWVKEVYKYSQYVKKKEEAYNNMYVKDFSQITIKSLIMTFSLLNTLTCLIVYFLCVMLNGLMVGLILSLIEN